MAFFTNYLLVNTGENNWRWMLLVMAAPAILLFVSMFLVPESPRWLVARNSENKALQVLMKTVGETDARDRLNDIKQTLQNRKEAGYHELFLPNIRPILWIGIMLAVFQQITGINTILYYAPKIFTGIGHGNDTALLQTVAIGSTNVLFTVVAMLIIDRIGRRFLILAGSAGMSAMFVCLALLYYTGNTAGIMVLIFILGYIAFFALSLGPAVWVVISEIFPNRLRSKGMSVAVVALWTACTIVSITFPVMLEALQGDITFMIFAFICLLNLLYVWKYVPETRGKTLEELEKKLVKH